MNSVYTSRRDRDPNRLTVHLTSFILLTMSRIRYPDSAPGGPAVSLPKRTGLLTDRYELTMVEAALADGTAERPCVFEVFTRSLPPGRTFGLVAGVRRVIEAIQALPPSPARDESLAKWQRVKARLESGIDAN